MKPENDDRQAKLQELLDRSDVRSMDQRLETRLNLRAELELLEEQLNELKTQFELYFTGIAALPPDKLHDTVKRQIRLLNSAPFKSSEMGFRLRTLKNRYQSFHTYFQRVMREKEAGVYVKDVFKAQVREQAEREEQFAQTAGGAAERGLKDLFQSYREALKRETGRELDLDFDKFKKNLIKRAKETKEKTGAKKLTFKVIVRDGKVIVQANPVN
ncbi:MAG: MXAN_5187 C-terminal domain-containing protein [Bdellovibrionota bacterium]|nr:MAG: MXAN_5187 C-terminal domain-containing protein [Bdellovibrionota bacterium]